MEDSFPRVSSRVDEQIGRDHFTSLTLEFDFESLLHCLILEGYC
jgi:hypothetical protein